jgi:hypothetical protein
MPRVAAVCALALVLGACGSDPPALPVACGPAPDDVAAALARAPRAVALPDGTRLSRCVRDADSSSDLQSVGVAFQEVAARLRTRAEDGDRQAAVALGYLAGATRAGAAKTQGVSSELAVRLGRVAGRLIVRDPALGAAVQQGLRAGERLG